MLRASAILARAAVPDVPDHATWDQLLDEQVQHGQLHPLEAALARTLPGPRRATFVAGRTAIRTAMASLREVPSPGDTPILRTPRGAPLLPGAVTGSVTHKRTLAMAAVAPRGGTLQHIGLDLEARPTAHDLERPSIARRILTAAELSWLEQFEHDALHQREQLLVHFALKEAVYKAIDPFVERYVRFTEVDLDLTHADDVRVTLHLPDPSVANIRVDAHWHTDGDWIVAMAYSHAGERRGSSAPAV
jgi:phosphopantetheine--protein transferase-like protein